jgi:LysM repeat protein
MVYTGIIVLQPKERHSYEGREPLTDEEYYEMTFHETDRVIREAYGVPIHIEHLGEQTRVGHVVQAGYDASRRVCVRFELDKTRDADVARNLIQAGYLRGLSLSHVRETSQPIEISLCFRGARPGTGIIACDSTETTVAARKRATHQMVQASSSARPRSAVFVQASASMDTSAAAAAAAPTTTQEAPAAQAPPNPNSVMSLVAQATGVSTAAPPQPFGLASPPQQQQQTDVEIEQDAMRAVLEAAGVPEDKKQRVLAGVMQNKATIAKITEHAVKLNQELETAKMDLERERKSKGDLTSTQIAMVARMIRAMDGDSAISPELDQRIKETHKDPLGVWTAMLPAVVQASATAMRFKEDAQRRTDASQTHALYQQYLRTTGWEPRPQQPPAPVHQQVVEASRGAGAVFTAPVPAPVHHQQQQWSFEQERDRVFKRGATLDLSTDLPKRAAAQDPHAAMFTETRRTLSGILPTVQFAMQQ